ncbi:hypothetical protein GCM10011529_05680 [Polymorphobacter glacialis]|uniref:Uncharacterized protein n=1 Tax=Sandarakinorhabdus glacialis TaxID=1614636 RepID=A0A916ZKC9_9SPHN|nr:hypothetical protein GCM10011529_05680 [Polymorphobacter glacialis]
MAVTGITVIYGEFVSVVRAGIILSLAGALWVVPSVGTRGQGTLGDRYVHPDEPLLGQGIFERAVLERGDARAAAAVGQL